MSNQSLVTTIDIDSSTLTSVFEYLDTAIILANLEREIVSMNRAAKALFSYEDFEVEGQQTKLLYADKSDFYNQGKRRFNADAEYSKEFYTVSYITKYGREFPGITTGGPIKDANGNNLFFVALIKDDTTRTAAEDTLNRLHSITASRQLNFEQRVKAILELGCEHFGLPIGIFSKIEGEQYIIQQAVHPSDALEQNMTFELGITYCSHVFQANDVQGFHHVSRSSIAEHPCFDNFALEAYIGAPIFVDGERYGTLNFSSPVQSRPFIKQDIELARLFAEWVGHEIARNNDIDALEQAHRQLEIVANTDALTGLANRGFLERTLIEKMAHYQQHDLPLTVALFDFDHFKSINDTFGHSAGDAALIQFARLTEQVSRKQDHYGRWGGEEFLALFPETGLTETRSILNQLNQQLADTGINYQQQTIQLTTSIGVTTLRPDDNLDSLLKRADMLLYLAKEKGRNCIETDKYP